MVGYSGTPLAKWLGIKPTHRAITLNAPEDFSVELPEGVSLTHTLQGEADVVVAFFQELAWLEDQMDRLSQVILPSGGLWIVWPKLAAKQATDVSADAIREAGFRRLLVDNKVCAIDETWTGLRLVWRVRYRNQPVSS